jgi:hypothetical protein
VAHKQIELATRGLWQIIVKLWKFFFLSTDDISGHLYISQSVVYEMSTVHERALLERAFLGRWIGRDGPVPWPPRSPDITPLAFFLWGYVKGNVFRTRT